jgi:long-chain acyl-CoA synthetase
MSTSNFDPRSHGLRLPETRPKIPDAPSDVPSLLARAAAACPDREGLVSKTRRYTFAEVERMSFKAANVWLSLGAGAGARIACSLPNECDIAIAYLGAMRVGAIWVGLNTNLTGPEVMTILADSEPIVLLTDAARMERFGDRADELPCRVLLAVAGGGGEWGELVEAAPDTPPEVEVDPFAPGAIAYTSGSTGRPKGAVHTQHGMVLVAVGQDALGRLQHRSVQGVVLPLALLNMQLVATLSAILSESTLVMLESTRPAPMAETIGREGVRSFAGVPTMVYDLLTSDEVEDEQLRTLERIWIGGGVPSDEFRVLFKERFGIEPGNGYGLTESPNGCVAERPGETHIAGATGRAYPTLRVFVVDDEGRELPPGEEGELCVGPTLEGTYAGVYVPMLGYWNRPEDTATALAGGVLHTGDSAVVDEAGNVFIKGRRNEMILRGGANVYPTEVEKVLAAYPGVRECAVFGIEDARLGERVVALVEHEEPGMLDHEEMREFCRASLAGYKVPSRIEAVDELPRGGLGKVLRRRLPAIFEELATRT